MNSTAIESNTGSSSSRYYFLVWLALGAAGIFYVTIAALAPEALHSAETSSLDATNQDVAGLHSSISQITKRIDASDSKQQAMASIIDTLRGDASSLKARFDTFGATVSTRLAALEGQQGPGTQASTGANKGDLGAQSVAKKTGSAPPIEGVVTPDESAVPPDPTLDEAPQASDKPAKSTKFASAAADAKPSTAPKPYAVDLAMSTSTDALRQIWQLFQDQHAELLTGLSPRSATAGANVRLLAGPFPNQAAAVAQCGKMRKAGLACTPTPLAGTPL